MKTRILLFATLLAGTVSIHAQNGNVGIGTTTPGTKLDVNGAITNRETSVNIVSNVATIPANVSQAILVGSSTTVVTVSAPAAPNSGQRLVIYNSSSSAFSANLGGFIIPNGQAQEFVYSNGAWRATGIAGDYDWMKAGNAMPNSPGDTVQNIYHMGGNVGIGTNTPHSTLDLGPAVTSAKLAVYNDAAGTDFYGFGLSGGLLHFHAAAPTPSTAPDMVLHSTGQLGVNIGATNPTANMDVGGTARIRSTPIVTPGLGATTSIPVYRDANGNIVTVAPQGHANIMSGRVVAAPGVSTLIIGNIPDGTIHKLTVTVANGCTHTAVADFWVIASSTGGSAMQGKDGFCSLNGTAAPTFAEAQTSTGVSFPGVPNCTDGGNTANLNFTMFIVASGGGTYQINIVNNGNVNRDYSAVLERIGAY